MAKVYLRRHRTEQGDMIAMCDEKALGRVYRDRKAGVVLDLKKYRNFYEGELVSPEDALKALSDADLYTGNIVGKEAVGVAVKAGLAAESEVRDIGGVPSLQIYRVR